MPEFKMDTRGSAYSVAVRANVRAILKAAIRRGAGHRCWPAVYPDTTNGVKAYAGRGAFGCRAPGAFALWWSEFRTLPRGGGQEEVRRGMWSPLHRQRIKAEARNLITQWGRIHHG